MKQSVALTSRTEHSAQSSVRTTAARPAKEPLRPTRGLIYDQRSIGGNLAQLARVIAASNVIQRAATASSTLNHSALPSLLKANMEKLSGLSLAHVRVHRNSSKPAQLNAHAYAQGSEIHLASGQEKHLPHEAWHVVQQAQGRVRPTRRIHHTAVNDDLSLEREADRMGQAAAHRAPIRA